MSRGHVFLSKEGKYYLVRCPKCERENYSMNVATGICTWCGYDANEQGEISMTTTPQPQAMISAEEWYNEIHKRGVMFKGDMVALLKEVQANALSAQQADVRNAAWKEELQSAFDASDGFEINQLNYNHDDVCALNNAFVELYLAVERALKTTPAQAEKDGVR